MEIFKNPNEDLMFFKSIMLKIIANLSISHKNFNLRMQQFMMIYYFLMWQENCDRKRS